MRMSDDFIWSLKYRPRKMEDIVLPAKLKSQFQKMIDSGKVGNILLSGRAGTGKTTAAFILAGTLEADTLYLNLSEDTGIDVIRTKVKQFISSVSFGGGKKVLIGDECERLSPQAQDSLKSILETFSKNCSFIFISNHKNKIIDPLKSRMQEIDFGVYTKNDTKLAKKEFFKALLGILKEENVEFEKDAVAQLVTTFFPDLRKCLNETQKLAQQGPITLESVNENVITDLADYFGMVKGKEFTKLRKYIANLSIDLNTFYSSVYHECGKYVKGDDLPQFILLLAKYQYESSFSVDPEIPLMAMSIEFMTECEIK